MMKFLVFFLLIVGLVFCSSEEGKRLIEFEEGKRVWISKEALEKYVSEKKSPFVGFMDVTDFQEKPTFIPKSTPLPIDPTKQSIVKPLLQEVKPEKIETTIKFLQQYHNRYYTRQDGYDAALWIESQFKEIISNLPAARRDLFTVEIFKHNFLQPSIICKMKGKSKSNEIVIIGGHEDSIAGGSTGRAPGADDNASGVAGVLEVFRVIAQSSFIPERSIEFHSYAAEEVGLYGSQEVVSKYSSDKKNIHVYLNFDMIGWEPSGADKSFGVITDYSSREATNFLKKVITEYSTIQPKETSCGYGCSDHASYTRFNFRSCFAIEGYPMSNYNKKIHTSGDLLSELSMKRAAEHVKYGIGFLVETSL